MRIQLFVRLCWRLILIGVAGFVWWSGRTAMAAGFFVGAALYAALSLAAFRRKRWATYLALLPPVLSLLAVGPNVVYNFYAFLTDDPLYLDSPGTIFIVGIEAIIFIIPAIIILVLSLVYRYESG